MMRRYSQEPFMYHKYAHASDGILLFRLHCGVVVYCAVCECEC
jgi:hypothetical protein